ncbi:MAG: bifunctional methylenetetrahydrofolate dehydrogenase/methenyltetrahydrofolate cyclohydrolase, partial [bacterium]|nr:bifunctional methylenetetrahydrofolate dehydrogenase/methenyltetrahydrofolate cyclohydrolase [bacterium]
MIIDGRKIAEELHVQLTERIAKLNFQPTLCDVVVGNDPVSLSFMRIKQRVAEKVGLRFNLVQLPEDATEDMVIDALN